MSTKDLIIQAATRLFAEKGYEGMTMKEIAREVGIKAPSLYAFFESKEDIFTHIYLDIITRHLDLASSVTRSEGLTVREQFEQMLKSIMEFQLQEPLQMKIYLRLLLFPPEVFKVDLKAELLKLEQAEQEIFQRLFEKGMARGEIKPGDSSALAKLLICLLDGLFWEIQRHDESTFWQRFQTVWGEFWQRIQAD
jgi:AcrR family transcriptional regulator